MNNLYRQMHFEPLIASAFSPEGRRLRGRLDLLGWYNLLHAATIRKSDATDDEYEPALFRTV